MLLDRLRGGTRQTLGESKAVAGEVLSHAELLPELLAAFETDDRVMISRAADALEIVGAARPELIQPYKRFVLTLLTQFEYWEVREHVCLMLPRLRLTAGERLEAFEIVRGWMADQSSIVRTFAMQTMWDLGKEDEVLREEAEVYLERALVNGTAAMKARARRLLGVRKRGAALGGPGQA